MNDKEMMELARKKQAERRRNGSIGYSYGANDRRLEEEEDDGGGSLDARARMAARMTTNSERMHEEAAERQAERDRQDAEKARFESLSPYEQAIERHKAEEAARLERWAHLNGWRSYQDYLDDQDAKRNGRY